MKKKTLQEKRDESIQRIMDAATEIFAESGFAGARVDEIAKRAGVNKAMIYYRIGDKKRCVRRYRISNLRGHSGRPLA
ncbi:MAG: helix-turn-helix transcriptional regulator [Deltaproteobacteria bacterium]|nr:helix-turn-helix transcriptional regulator [Deltaproteobacteria bacterium]